MRDMTKTGDTMAVEPVVYGASRAPRAVTTPAPAPTTPAPRDWNAYRAGPRPGAACTNARAHSCPDWPAMPSSPHCPGWSARAHSAAGRHQQHLHRATGWGMVAVPGLIPRVPFFTLLATHKFRSPTGSAPESSTTSSSPDIFRDLFGRIAAAVRPGVCRLRAALMAKGPQG